MAFPTTPVLDNFNRADGALGASWDANQVFAASATLLQIFTNELGKVGGANWGSASWATIVGADTEVYAKVTKFAAGATDQVVFLFARLKDEGTTGADGYGVYVEKAAGNDTWQIYQIDNGAQTLKATLTATEVALSDILGMSVVGNVVSAYKNGTLVGTWTDGSNTYPLAGKVGLEIYQAAQMDDFGGGTVVSTALTVTKPRLIYMRANR